VFERREKETECGFFFTKSDKVTVCGAEELATDPNDRNSKESVEVPAVAVP
jgi:hypothetical protein